MNEAANRDWRLAADSPPGSRELPTDGHIGQLRFTGDYFPSEELVAALNTALLLGQPLLLTGEPGCGKSEFAGWVSQRLGLGRNPLRFDVKSTTSARDLFYQIDNIERFHQAHERKSSGGIDGKLNPIEFIRFNALGEAIIRANPPQEIMDLAERLDSGLQEAPSRAVVLIDEIDKAPRDVPNDLLREIEECSFQIAELGYREVSVGTNLRPIIIMTSNAERALPDPFLRRCVFFYIEPPSEKRLREIVNARLPEYPPESAFIADVVRLYLHVRGLRPAKLPGVAELLALILALRGKDYDSNTRLKDRKDWQLEAQILLLKNTQDQKIVESQLDQIEWG